MTEKHRSRREDAGLEEEGEDYHGGDAGDSLDAAMREAVAAVEAVENRKGNRRKEGSPVEEAPSGGSKIGPGGEQVERLQQELAAARDASLRTLADFDNFRKRMEKERQEIHRYALVEPMREFLPVIDNLERALAAGGRAEDLKTGVELILKQMRDLLQRFHVQPVAAEGVRFDPTVHEAVLQEEDPEAAEPMVRQELQKGYVLHDRLLRPAMVKVAMPAAGKASSGPRGGPEG